jgi:hypothetical protein
MGPAEGLGLAEDFRLDIPDNAAKLFWFERNLNLIRNNLIRNSVGEVE